MFNAHVIILYGASIYLICGWIHGSIVQYTFTKPKWCWLFNDDMSRAIKAKYKSCRHDIFPFSMWHGMAWHDKFKSCGSANFLFHFSLTRYRNWILFTLLRQLDGLRQSSSWHFIIFHPTTKIERSKGCAAWKSNRANGLFIPFGHKTIYMYVYNWWQYIPSELWSAKNEAICESTRGMNTKSAYSFGHQFHWKESKKWRRAREESRLVWVHMPILLWCDNKH